MVRVPWLGAVVLLSCVPACGGCGDDDPATPDGGADAPAAAAPVLIARSPGPTDTNVSQRAPIVLEFDRALDPASVTVDAVILAYDDLEVPLATVELSADGTTITGTYAPLTTPRSLTIAITELLVGANGTPVEYLAWGVSLPVWHRATLPDVAADRPAAAAGTDASYVAWIDSAGTDAALRVSRAEPAGPWTALGDALATGAVSSPALASRTDGSPVALWVEGSAVRASQWTGDSWGPLGAALSASGAMPRIAVGADDAPIAAVVEAGTSVRVQRYLAAAWQAVGAPIAAGNTVGELAVAARGSAPVVAFVDSVTGDITVASQSGAAIDFDVTTLIDRRSASRDAELALAADSDRAYLAWVDDDGQHSYVAVASIASDGARVDLPGALDLELDAAVSSPALVVADGVLYASWVEAGELWVARWNGTLSPPAGAWQVLGADVADRDGIDPGGARSSLVVTAQGDPLVAWRADSGLVATGRYNASPEVPRGLETRRAVTTCAIPVDGAGFPDTLTATGCYANVAAHDPAPELVPYQLRAPLWSDGAAKRRFFLVPDGAAMTRTDVGAWEMPVGTILVKEFWIEETTGDPSTLIPMETRFFVKRCEPGASCTTPWQGYSYQWNADGTEGTLLSGANPTTADWTVSTGGVPALHTHSYPSRSQCIRCHNAASGFTLGLRTEQLERPARFGALVDDQLRAWQHVGLLDSVPASAGSGLPRPADPSLPYGARSRAYLDVNCAHCHRPGGERDTIDFRYSAPLSPTNICDRVVAGDAASSALYIKDATRPPDVPSVGGQPMPPLATLLTDDDQLARTAAWIDGMTSCP